MSRFSVNLIQNHPDYSPLCSPSQPRSRYLLIGHSQQSRGLGQPVETYGDGEIPVYGCRTDDHHSWEDNRGHFAGTLAPFPRRSSLDRAGFPGALSVGGGFRPRARVRNRLVVHRRFDRCFCRHFTPIFRPTAWEGMPSGTRAPLAVNGRSPAPCPCRNSPITNEGHRQRLFPRGHVARIFFFFWGGGLGDPN